MIVFDTNKFIVNSLLALLLFVHDGHESHVALFQHHFLLVDHSNQLLYFLLH